MDNLRVLLISVCSTAGLGIFFAAVLAAANKTLRVEEDPRIAAVEDIIPGLNCGACGYAGCQAFAIALLKGDASPSACSAGGKDVAEKLSELLGVEKKEAVKRIALLHCNANNKENTVYKGIETCAASNLINGVIGCKYGCLGYGDCAIVCPFGAISMVDGLPHVDPDKCTACGKCVNACPRGLYKMGNYSKHMIIVACNSLDKGPKVRKVCPKGCIACRVCEKLSGGVFKVEDNLARVDYESAKSQNVDWEKSIAKCPTKVIVRR